MFGQRRSTVDEIQILATTFQNLLWYQGNHHGVGYIQTNHVPEKETPVM
jgi:hypothetical protein